MSENELVHFVHTSILVVSVMFWIIESWGGGGGVYKTLDQQYIYNYNVLIYNLIQL